MDMIFQGMSMSLFQAKQQWSRMVVVGFEDAVREPIVAHELPDVLDRIELGRFRRQRQERDVVWDGKPLRDMPSRLIKKKDSVRARRDRKRDFLQMKRHGFTVAGL